MPFCPDFGRGHQSMNVGLAVHARTVLDFFARNGVQARVA
jgi:hypothetical protein